MTRKALAPVLCLVVLLSFALGHGGSGVSASYSRAPVTGEYVPGEVIVKYKKGIPESNGDRLLSSERLSVQSESPQLHFRVVKVPPGGSVRDTVEKLSSDPRVEYAEPNYIDHTFMTPDDPLYPNQWHMQGFGSSGGIDATAAWDTERGDPNVIVAVVDTGVAYENYNTYSQAPDLAGTTFVDPYDAVDGDAHPSDDVGHGTHVAGTIAQSTNNALGVAGVAHGCTIMPIRSLGPGGGSHAQMADAFAWATDHGAKVINYSAGGSDSQTKRDGCRYAHEHGVTICASAGNNNTYNDASGYPANYDEYCICVGATNRSKASAWYSNYGTHQDVVGPGGDTTSSESDGVIQQTYNSYNDHSSGFGYHGWQGTSMACPHVSATAALFISNTGVSNPDAVKLQLEATAHDLGSAGWDQYFGYGLVDANAALEQAVPLVAEVEPTHEVAGAPVTVRGIHFGDTRGTSTVEFNGTEATSYTDWSDTEISVNVPGGATAGPVTAKTTDGTSNAVEFTVDNPMPAINTISPDRATLGGPGFTLSVDGTGFLSDSTVRWNGADKATSLGSGELHATILDSDISAAGTATVTVFNPSPGGGLSTPKEFAIEHPAPTVAGISPDTAGNDGQVSVTVTGAGFRSGASAQLRTTGTGQALSAASPRVTSPTSIDCTFDLEDAAPGPRDVVITNSDGKNGTLEDAFDILPSTWYLPEGTTAWGFETYVSIVNPNEARVSAEITYNTVTGPVTGPTLDLAPLSRATVYPRATVGERDFSTRVVCSQGKAIAVDRTMIWTGQGASAPEGHSSVGVTAPATTWYLPEGSSAWGFECWLLIQNPGESKANCNVTYMIEGGSPVTKAKEVAANSRASFNMFEDIGSKDASIKVTSDRPVIPERSMYRNNRREGHDSTGTTTPATDGYLAEGSTAWGFTTYVLVQNPNASPCDVTVTYMTEEGPRPQPAFKIPANSRRTIRVNDYMPDTDFSTWVHGTMPIIAERAMYWDSGYGEACHDSIGMSEPHTTFYMPDGQAGPGIETWTLVQNPNAAQVDVEVTYVSPDGTRNKAFTARIEANARKSFNMEDRGIEGRAGIIVTSKTPGAKIMCERAMYFEGRAGGTDTVGGTSD